MSSVSLCGNEWHYSEYCVRVHFTLISPVCLQPTVKYSGAASVGGKVRFMYIQHISCQMYTAYVHTVILAIVVKLCYHTTFFLELY